MLRLRANSYLFRQGEAPTTAFLIEHGRVEIIVERASGEVVVAVRGPGDIVGEMAIVDWAPRSASIRTLDDCGFLPLTVDQISKRVASADPVLRMVLDVVLHRFRNTLSEIGERKLVANALRSTPGTIAAASAQLRMEQEFGCALREGEIVLHYQPIVVLKTGRLAGFEALARWNHPNRGLVPPSVFIPVAETSGLSADLAAVCVRAVVKDLPPMALAGLSNAGNVAPLEISINVSAVDIPDPTFMARLCQIAEDGGIAPSSIKFELTETALVRNHTDASTSLDRVRASGFGIAVDDFGTGYSGLSYVQNLPVDTLKIDRSFVRGLNDSVAARSIVTSMLQLADSLNVSVVAEGIETHTDAAMLRQMGCELGQGYLLGRPRPLRETLELIRAWTAADTAALFEPERVDQQVA